MNKIKNQTDKTPIPNPVNPVNPVKKFLNPWPKVRLGEVLAERQERPTDDDLFTGRFRIIEKIGFNNGHIVFRADAATKTGMILVRPGDLVVSGINAAKGAIAVFGKENDKPIIATIHYGAYAPNKDRVDVWFLWWMLRSGFFRELLLEYVPGGIKTELKAKRLLPVPIPLPPLAEQRRIVARIEELAAQIAEARSLRDQAAEEAKVLFRSTVSATVSSLPINGTLAGVLTGKPRNGWSVRCDNADSGVSVLSLSAVTGFRYDCRAFKRTSEPTNAAAYYWLEPGDILIT